MGNTHLTTRLNEAHATVPPADLGSPRAPEAAGNDAGEPGTVHWEAFWIDLGGEG